jgi:hypothetical protein
MLAGGGVEEGGEGMSACQHKSNLTPEEKEKKLMVVARQYTEAFKTNFITCECGQKRNTIRNIYKCFFCGEWFCQFCGKEHFGENEKVCSNRKALAEDYSRY